MHRGAVWLYISPVWKFDIRQYRETVEPSLCLPLFTNIIGLFPVFNLAFKSVEDQKVIE